MMTLHLFAPKKGAGYNSKVFLILAEGEIGPFIFAGLVGVAILWIYHEYFRAGNATGRLKPCPRCNKGQVEERLGHFGGTPWESGVCQACKDKDYEEKLDAEIELDSKETEQKEKAKRIRLEGRKVYLVQRSDMKWLFTYHLRDDCPDSTTASTPRLIGVLQGGEILADGAKQFATPCLRCADEKASLSW